MNGERENWNERYRSGEFQPPESYSVLRSLPDIKDALAPGGSSYEHHLRSANPVERGPSTDRHRLRSNDLLRSCLDLTILYYEEKTHVDDGRKAAIVQLIGRNSTGGAQKYPNF